MAHRNFDHPLTLSRGVVALPISFACSGSSAPSLNTAITGLPCTVSRTGTGVYRILLGASTTKLDSYKALLACQLTLEKSTATAAQLQVNAYDVTSATAPYVDIMATDGSTNAADLTGTIHVTLWLKVSSAK